MCLIVAVTKKTPPLSLYENANTLNPDGIGISWIQKNGLVKWHKGLDISELKSIAPFTPIPYVVHFRIATSGGVMSELCHPFPISRKVSIDTDGEAKRTLFHNGIWFDWKEQLMKGLVATGHKLPLGPWSDTRAMAFLAYHYGEKILELTDEKVVVLSKDGIKFYGSGWVEKDGANYSNSSAFESLGPAGTYRHYVMGNNYREAVAEYRRANGISSSNEACYGSGCDDGWDEEILNDAANRGLEAQASYDRKLKEVSTEIMEKTDTTWFRGRKFKFQGE